MEGAGGRGVMLEAGAHRCLVTMVPPHIPAKGDLPQMYTGYVKTSKQYGCSWEGAERRGWWSLSIFILLLGWTWQLSRRTTIAWLQHESNAERSLQQLQGCTGSQLPCSDKPRGTRNQQKYRDLVAQAEAQECCALLSGGLSCHLR